MRRRACDLTMKTQTLRQTATFAATPHQVYEILTDSRRHARLTGAPARISRRIGGVFTAFGGGLSGTTLDLVADRKIVLAWRADDWPAGHHSRVTFTLRRLATGGTRLRLYQSGVPAAQAAGVNEGWIRYYWAPLKALFNQGGSTSKP